MPYRVAKISFDGSHYIATPKENFPQGHKRRRTTRLAATCPRTSFRTLWTKTLFVLTG